jgi:hypothetical protein
VFVATKWLEVKRWLSFYDVFSKFGLQNCRSPTQYQDIKHVEPKLNNIFWQTLILLNY